MNKEVELKYLKPVMDYVVFFMCINLAIICWVMQKSAEDLLKHEQVFYILFFAVFIIIGIQKDVSSCLYEHYKYIYKIKKDWIYYILSLIPYISLLMFLILNISIAPRFFWLMRVSTYFFTIPLILSLYKKFYEVILINHKTKRK